MCRYVLVFKWTLLNRFLFAVLLDSVKYTSIGCLNDWFWYPIVPSLEGQDPRLDGDYKQREKAIQKCALISKERGYRVFAIQDGGKCMSSSTAHKTINRAGRPTQCKRHGRGEFMVTHFYVIGEMKSMTVCTLFFLKSFSIRQTCFLLPYQPKKEQRKVTFDFPHPGTPGTRLLQTIPYPRARRAGLCSGGCPGGMVTGGIEPYITWVRNIAQTWDFTK